MIPIPPLDAMDERPVYNTHAVVAMTRVPAPSLRAWERRYAIPSPRLGRNNYRLYSQRDLAVI